MAETVSVSHAPASSEDRREKIQTVQRACRLLSHLSTLREPESAAALCEATGFSATVVRRLLRSLNAEGLVSERANRYSVGPLALVFSNAHLDTLAVYRVALPYAISLHARLSATRPWVISLAMPVCGRAVLLDRLMSPHAPLNGVLEAGTRFPMDGSALGRCMLAYLDEHEAAELVGEQAQRDLSIRLEDIRSNGGVDVAKDELQPGISALAAAIVDQRHRPIAAISVSGTAMDQVLSPDSQLALSLRRIAARVSDSYESLREFWQCQIS